MQLITLDFETYYDRDYSLSKITTEEYVRSDLFEVIGVGVKVDNGETQWASGTHEDMRSWLRSSFNWDNAMVLAHNTMFDGAILNWRFGVRPRVWLDTLCMGRAVHGVEVSGSLKALAERYNLGEKGTEVLNALGKRRLHFTDEELSRYGDYCINDVELTYKLFNRMVRQFPKQELRVIDTTLRMFIEPKLELDLLRLEQHLAETRMRKEKLLSECGVEKEDLMSNQKFAELLKTFGVEPPTKTSPTTGKETLAFAKNDEAFLALAEHPDDRVQALVAARLGTKSTLEETRTQRFIDIAKRGTLPVPIRYYAAHTGRWGGSDKINFQNFPSRGDNAGKLKKAILAPEGHVIIDCDSAQIEARVLAWFAQQDDLVEAFRNGEDVYKIMASAIYRKEREEVTPSERFVGKTTILGAGYGMGSAKFQTQLKTFGVSVSAEESARIISTYRGTYPSIPTLWKSGSTAIDAMSKKRTATWGNGCISISAEGILMPNGLYQRYPNLRKVRDKDGKDQYIYDSRKGAVKLYGGKLTENICQGLARCIIGEQLIKISRKYRVVLTVHDAVACVAPKEEAQEAMAYVMECMRFVPSWAEGIPLNCEAGIGESYGDC